MLQSFLKAVAQLGGPALRGVLWIGILGSLLLFVGLWIGLWFLFAAVDASMIPGVAWLETAFGVVFYWLAGLSDFAALLMASLLDRKSAAYGRSVSGRVKLDCCRFIKKNIIK